MKLTRVKVFFLSIFLVIVIFCFLKFSFWVSVIVSFTFVIFFILNKSIKNIVNAELNKKCINKRNFDYLILGSTKVWKYISHDNGLNGKNAISFAFYRRSLYADFLILKHKFSYLKENGKVIVILDCQNLKTAYSHSLHFPEINLLHRITIERLRINQTFYRFCFSYPILFAPIYSLGMYFKKGISIGSMHNGVKMISEHQKAYIITMILKIVDFCLERELKPEIVFMAANEARINISEMQAILLLKNINIHQLDSVNQISGLM